MGKWDLILDGGWLGAGTGDGQGDRFTSETAGRGGTFRGYGWVVGNGEGAGAGFSNSGAPLPIGNWVPLDTSVLVRKRSD